MSELHAISAGGGAPRADVIFVHGLDGDPFRTWQHDPKRQTDCWPHWLAGDEPQVAIHTLEYAASSSEWLGPAMPLGDRAKEVLNELARQGIGRRPIVWVCHSLGGLLVKQLLRTGSELGAEDRWRPIAEQTKGIVFVATPHAGADPARTLRRIGWALRTSPAIDDLQPHASSLRELNEWYRGFVKPHEVRTLCYYEAYRTMATRFRWLPFAVKVVQPADADPGVDGTRPMPLDADHRSICKPSRKDHQLYDAVLELLRDIAPPAPRNDKPIPADPLRMRADLDDFQPRGDSQRMVLEALDRGPAATVAIHGMGGGGKSALAVHVAHELERAGESPDGQRFLDLQGVSTKPLSPLETMAQIVQSFDEAAARPADEEGAAIAYRKALDGKRVLLVLDDARDDAQVAPLLRHRAPTTRVVVTSRRAVTAEGIKAVALDEMSLDEARDFLLGLIGEGRGSDQEIDRLVRRCGRLPLALRVAGRFLRGHPGLGIGEYIEAVDQAAVEFAVPGEPDTDVRAVLGLSAKALGREDLPLVERWQMLAAFPDDLDRDAAAAVWEVEAAAAGLQLSQLAARSMVMFDEAGRRWRLHDLMRDVAQVPLEGQEGTALEARLEAARERHARHYLGVLWQCDALYEEKGRTVEWLALYDLEQRNIAAGRAWAVARIEADDAAARLAADYANAGVYVLSLRLHPREWVDWLEAQRKACVRLGYRQGVGAALGNLGNAWANLGEPQQAMECHEQDLAIRREIGDRQGEGNALNNLGNAWLDLDQPRRAIGFYRQWLEIAREMRDRRGEGNALGNLGGAYRILGSPRRAIVLCERNRAIASEIGDQRGECIALGSLGNAWAALGEPRRAIEYHEKRLVIAREMGDRMSEGNALYNSALALDALGERAEAVRRAQEALAVLEAIGAKHLVEKARAQLAEWGAGDEGS